MRRRARRRCPGLPGDAVRCGKAATFRDGDGRVKSDPQHTLCNDCWARAERIGTAKGKRLLSTTK